MLNAETAFYDYMNKHPDTPVRIVASTDATTSSQIPVPKGNERLVAAINEALEIAKKYETPETVKFMNGILGSFVRQELPE